VNPFSQPDYENEEAPALKVEMPYALSIMATNDPKGYVPGINDLLNGYTRPDGTREPSADEKIAMGQKAIAALAAYRKAKAEGADASVVNAQLDILNANIRYFGYGYVKDKHDLVPYVPINFWAFRIMVGLGCLFIAFFALVLAVAYRWPRQLFAQRDITALPAWHYWGAIALIPLAYIASES
jgi:cytochrome d ubiquinol oxidase subunit I